MSKYFIIVNPTAGRRKGEKILRRIEGEISHFRIDAQVVLTECPGHATQLARETSSEIVVAAGGDGTVNEVVNGIIGTKKILGVLPIGSGNDFIKSIGIPKDFRLAFEKIRTGKTKRIDCGTVICRNITEGGEQTSATERYFANGVGIGFDAAVAERTNRIKFLSGTAVYVLAVFQTLGKYHSPEFTIGLDSVVKVSRNLLIAIGNGRSAGGAFYLTPDAKVDDGMLDVCMISEIPIWKIISIMPKVMRGKHTDESEVTMIRARTISVTGSESFFVHADGEIVGRNVNAAEVRIAENALNVIVG